MAHRVLVVEDDPTVAEVLVAYLQQDGHEVTHTRDGRQAWLRANAEPPDLAVLDLMLPGMSGIDLCTAIRAAGPPLRHVPVLMLTALGDEADRVLGLEVGADDYVTKPFSPRELVLRVRSLLRRGAAPTQSGVITDGDLVVDTAARRATRGGVELALTSREFDLLAFFIAHPAQAYSRADLLEQVWGWTFGDHSTVTVHVRRLREKVETDPANPTRLATVWGVGYRWDGSRAVIPSSGPDGTTAAEATRGGAFS